MLPETQAARQIQNLCIVAFFHLFGTRRSQIDAKLMLWRDANGTHSKRLSGNIGNTLAYAPHQQCRLKRVFVRILYNLDAVSTGIQHTVPNAELLKLGENFAVSA